MNVYKLIKSCHVLIFFRIIIEFVIINLNNYQD